MNRIFFILKILAVVVSMAWVYYYTAFNEVEKIYKVANTYNIDINNISKIRSDLDLVSVSIANKTNADIVWVNIFHQNPNKKATTGPIKKEDILLTALHHWIKTNHKIQIRLVTNQPITDLPQIDETLSGKCIGRINSSSNPYELSEVSINRLVLRCPLYDFNNNLIGIYGMSYFYFDQTTVNKDQFVNDHSIILQSYKKQILDIILD